MRRWAQWLILVIILIFVSACGQQTSTSEADGTGGQAEGEEEAVNIETQQLKLISFLDVDHQFTRDVIPMWIEEVEKGTGGALEIEWIGGPETIPVAEQFDAVRNGIADIGFNTSSYYGHVMPESHALHMSPYTHEEERNNGFFDYLQERFNEQGLVYLGRWLPAETPFYFWSNKKVSSLADLEGLRFRSNPTYHEILEALNVTPVEVVPGEVYTALERNMVDGFGFPLLGPHETGWTEVTKYIIDEPFLNQNATILINKERFDSLSPELQDKLMEITAQFEYKMVEHFKQEVEKTWELITEQGVERIEFNEEDSKRFQEIVMDVYWAMMERTAPDQVERLRELLN